METNMNDLDDYTIILSEKFRLEELKQLRKQKVDYDQILKTIPIDEIEKYLRRLKLDNIKTKVHGIL